MSSSSDSFAAPGSVADAPGIDLVERHRQLRARLRWLLPVGAALLLLLLYELITLPKRAPLMGYRYQQVGVQPDSTWWILAYRAGKAEILFSHDTARGWQRRELNVGAAEARSLALNWGGKAILVGDGGAVRVYDAQFRLLDSVRHPLGRKFRARWVAADYSGQAVIALGDSGATYMSQDGGRKWYLHYWPYRWFERAAFSTNNLLHLANRADNYIGVSISRPAKADPASKSKEPVALFADSEYPSFPKAEVAQLAPPVDKSALLYFRPDTTDRILILRQDGSAANSQRHYTAAELTDTFPAGFNPIDAAFLPGQSGACLVISPTRVFAGRLGGPFAAPPPAGKADSNVKSTTNQPDTTAKVLDRKTPTTANKTKPATASPRKKPLNSSPSHPVQTPAKHPPSVPKPDTTGNAAARKQAQDKLKSGGQNPFQQTTPAGNPVIQQALPADDNKPQPTKGNTPKKPESAR